MSNKTLLTKDQFTKLGCDSHACLRIALMTESHIEEIKCYPTSTAGLSLSTVMMTNLGMGIELMLKLLYYKTTNSIHTPTHELVKIYDSLNPSTELELTEIFNDYMSQLQSPQTLAVAYIQSKTQPGVPSMNLQSKGFRSILEFLDSIGLYSRRYSFEDFSYSDWWHVISPKALAPYLNKITEFTNNLPDPAFKQ